MNTLNDRQAAKFLGVALQTLRNWRSIPKGPAFVKIGKRVIYTEADLLDYMDRHKIEPERDQGSEASKDEVCC
jgi:predicted site-specific integrase-resolvase